MYIFYKYGFFHSIRYAPYDFKIKLLSIETLENRRVCACHFFMFDLLSGRVDALNFLTMININVPPFSFRNHRFLKPIIITVQTMGYSSH